MTTQARRLKSIQKAHKKRTGKTLSKKAALSKLKAAKKFVSKELKSKPKDLISGRQKKWVKLNKKALLAGKISTKKRKHVLNLIADLSEMSAEEIDGIVATYARKEDSGVYRFQQWAKSKGIL